MVRITHPKYKLLKFEEKFIDYKFTEQDEYTLGNNSGIAEIRFAKTKEVICQLPFGNLHAEVVEHWVYVRLKARKKEDVKQLMHIEVLSDNQKDKDKMIKEIVKNIKSSATHYFGKDPLRVDFVNTARPSLLSSDFMETANLRGFLNLLALIMVAQNFSLMIQNMTKYGNIFAKTFIPAGQSLSE